MGIGWVGWEKGRRGEIMHSGLGGKRVIAGDR
jgi:hypothetical protein